MLPALDLSSLLTFVVTAIALVFGSLLVVKKAASKYFVVDASFEAGEGYDSRHRMSIGGGGEDRGGDGDAVCAACGMPGTKRCSGCQRVRYCSHSCQSKHWGEHRPNCKPVRCSEKVDSPISGDGAYRRRKSSGFGSISLVPARGSCKELQKPKKILFPYDEFVKLFNWDKPGFPPCGLLNCGNSCFANVVLQCLACTRPLTAYLLEKDHSRSCVRKQEDWCFLCELQAHIQTASQTRQPFSPHNILSRIPNIGGNLGYGSQEDAHEFMRFAIDTMQSICLDEHGGEKALDPSTQETTLIQHIFGGHLQSQVTCTKCNMISNRYENMMDLTVEIHGDAESLEECLEQFTVKEWLDGDNMYKCDGCNGYVKAWKRLTVHQAPNILTIALKRFQSGRFGKLNKRVTFPEELDLSPYMSEDGDGTNLYALYAVVVHVDMLNASFFGHYICYTKDHSGWYRIDDCKVTRVDVEEVLSQGAYMLLYRRVTARKAPFVKPLEPARKKHLASRDIDSSDLSNAPKGESMSVDITSFPSDVGSESNSDLLSLSSNTSSGSNLSLMRDTGHDRQGDITDAIKAKEIVVLDVPAEINPMGDVDKNDFELSSLGPKVHLGEGPSRPSHIHEDMAAVSPTDTDCFCPATSSSAQVQDMECEESKACGEEISIHHCCTQEDVDDVSQADENIYSQAAPPSSTQIEDMECDKPSGIHDSNSDSKDNGSSCIIGGPRLSDYTTEGSFSIENIVPNMAVPPSNASITALPSAEQMDTSMDSERKAESMIEEEHCPSGPTNAVSKSADISCSNGRTKSLAPVVENGFVGKPQPIFSPGFLDRGTGEKAVDYEKRIKTGKKKVAASSIVNGYTNGQAVAKKDSSAVTFDLQPLRGKSVPSHSNSPFMNRGFLNKPYRKSAAVLKNGQANGTRSARVVGSSSEVGTVTNCNSENGWDISKKDAAPRPEEDKNSNGIALASRPEEDENSNGVAVCPSKLMNGTCSQDEHMKFGEFNGMVRQ